MTMQLVEQAWLLNAKLGFREMVAPHPDGTKSAELRRLWRLHERTRERYWRRKRAWIAAGGAAW